ncbi:MAG: AlkA N-terminal domain-containing protein [Candidatus Eisenbacteria bacterium]
MNLDGDLCYEALRSRDARFDGRFFTGVRTTGIYCRPVCPAPRPKRSNVVFYPCAAAAEEAGFRPCRRCRPETAPGTPSWIGTSATVRRALRLIDEGALDEGDVPALAERLGVGDRHLRRLFRDHLGATPGRLAQTLRIHFARRLIDQTDLPLTDVAFAAGFGSVRRFHEAIAATFGTSPRNLRSRSGGAQGRFRIELPYRPPLDRRALFRFLAKRAVPGVESVDGFTYRRSALLGDLPGVIEIRSPAEGSPFLLSLPFVPPRGLLSLVEGTRRLFDLDADPLPIEERLLPDPHLAPLVRRRPGLRVPGAWDGFELAVRAVLGQQVSVAGAATLAGRLAERFGRPLPREERGIRFLFPSAGDLAKARPSGGLPAKRAAALRTLARAAASGDLELGPWADPDEATRRLLEIEGIGPWTVAYIRLRAFRDPDAFPAGDLGVRKGLSMGDPPMTARRAAALAEPWRPWRGYGAMHLWTELAEREKP